MNTQIAHDHATLRFSVVIPTYQRRTSVVSAVRLFAQQEYQDWFEVIVVVDGSTDGTAQALRALDIPFPLIVEEQPNQGRSAACNRGAALARGEILLFLDDDMEAHPQLLAEHDRLQREGADMVLGHIPLQPKSPRNVLSAGVEFWADQRAKRLSVPGATLTIQDMITGQASLRRELFHAVGGFDPNFTRGGTFGNEDLDFGLRFLSQGYRVVFNPRAISWQYYAVKPSHYLRQWHQAGQADVAFVRKHPSQVQAITTANRANKPINRFLWRPFVALPILVIPFAAILRWISVLAANSGFKNIVITKLFFEIRRMEYWRGVREAGGMPQNRPVRVLAYHAIADLAGAPVYEPYGIPPELFRRQLATLKRFGFRFVEVDEFLRYMRGESGVPRGALLLTFDDGYAELLDVVLPILNELAIPAVVFAVSERLGGTNDWDVALGAPQLRLMDADALHRLAESGIEIGAHSRTHPFLTRVSKNQLHAEIAGSVADLEAIGLARPRLFAYPHGEWNQTVKQAAREAGLQAGFTIDPNLSRSNQDPYQIPRIEILRQDVGWKFLYKVVVAGLWTRLPLTRALIDLSSTLRTQLRHRLRQRALRQRNVSQR